MNTARPYVRRWSGHLDGSQNSNTTFLNVANPRAPHSRSKAAPYKGGKHTLVSLRTKLTIVRDLLRATEHAMISVEWYQWSHRETRDGPLKDVRHMSFWTLRDWKTHYSKPEHFEELREHVHLLGLKKSRKILRWHDRMVGMKLGTAPVTELFMVFKQAHMENVGGFRSIEWLRSEMLFIAQSPLYWKLLKKLMSPSEKRALNTLSMEKGMIRKLMVCFPTETR